MNGEEWRDIVHHINHDIGGIVRAQTVLNEINQELHDRQTNPIEEDFIFSDGFRQDINTSRIITIDGIDLRIRVLHRKGMRQSDIKGADLLYEIEDRKFILIQYKTPDRQDRVTKDEDQFVTLISACPNPCPPPYNSLWPTCGSWFCIKKSNYSSYMPACSAQSIFGSAKSRKLDSFNSGISTDVFQQLFARCWIGARISPSEFAYLSWRSLEQDRVIFSVLQLNR